MDKQFLCLDSPTDFMVGKYISADELKEFINIPCKIKAGVFILCMEGQIRSTINMSELTTSKLNVVTLLPNSRIQIHEISPDILIYFIAFSFDFMCYTNFIKSTMGYLLMIYRYPIIKISQNRANLITNFYELLYQYIIRKTKCFDFWERNVLFPKTKRSFFRTPKHPLPCPFPLNFSLLIITKKFGNLAKNRYICIV